MTTFHDISPMIMITCRVPPRLLQPHPSSMAALTLRCYCYCYSSSVTIGPRRKTSTTTAMIRASISMDDCSSSESKKKSNSVSFTGKVNKVYEDKNMGILCYTDENGELVCEGLDEGPRLTWQDVEKLDMENSLCYSFQIGSRREVRGRKGRVAWGRRSSLSLVPTRTSSRNE